MTNESNVMAQYRHLVGGHAYGVAHEAGDPVAANVPKKKLAEWLVAGIIEPIDEPEGEDL